MSKERVTENNQSQNKSDRLIKVANSLERVNSETNEMVVGMAKGMNEMEIVNSFNQTSLDFFNLMINITKKMGLSKEYGFEAYLIFYEQAKKVNAYAPIDQFTLIVLEFAPEIYTEDEDNFMKMEIPDTELKGSTNEFSLIRSAKFKKLWTILRGNDKEEVKNHIKLLTTYAHTYFIYKLLKKK